jgi:hypothetical protein
LFALFLIDCLIEIAVSISTNGDTTPMIDAINRRTAITRLLGAAAAGLTPVAVKAAWTTQRRDGGPTGRELGDMNRIGWGFMRPHPFPVCPWRSHATGSLCTARVLVLRTGKKRS